MRMLRGRRNPLRPAIILPLLLGLALLIKGAPMVVAELLRVPHGATVATLSERPPPAANEIRLAMLAYERALQFRDDGRHWAELGQLRCALADQATGSVLGQVMRNGCIEALIRALDAEPALPYAALRLAFELSRTEGLTPTALRAYEQSVAAGPSLPSLLIPRTAFAIAAWGALDDAARQAGRAQIVTMAKLYPAELRLLAVTPSRLRLIEDALAVDPALLLRFRGQTGSTG